MTAPRLRALLVTMDLPPTRGGIQTVAREIIARATRTDLTVIGPANPDARDDPPNVHRVRAPGRRALVAAIASAAYRRVRAEKPDVVLALHVLAAPGVLLARAPTVVVTYGGELRSSRIKRVARMVLPRARRVVAISRYTRSASVALGADPMRTSVVLVGAPEPVEVHSDRVRALRDDVGGRFVLSVARLAPHKGQERLIAALPSLPDDVKLVLVGDGPRRDRLETQARTLGVADRVRFAGIVSDEDLPVYYAAADAFALLSQETSGATAGVEGGGIVLLEACAYGLPCVAASTGGIPETIREGETGLLVQPDDTAAVARALRRVLEDRVLADKLAANAKAMAAGERSWAHVVDRLETVLEAAAGRA